MVIEGFLKGPTLFTQTPLCPPAVCRVEKRRGLGGISQALDHEHGKPDPPIRRNPPGRSRGVLPALDRLLSHLYIDV
jgi:hypothetical protein